MAIARLTNLSYWYPGSEHPALREVGLDIEQGLTLVTGPSGGGKSTLLRVMNGLVPHFHGGRIAGAAEVEGLDVIKTPTRRLAQTVGFVFQDAELQTVYDTVDREVAFGLENIALPAREMADRVEEALTAAGVVHLAKRSVRTLSGGERQRVALASALAMRPRIVVLDEPTSQLDGDGATMVIDAVMSLIEQGRSAVIAEHRLDRLVPVAGAQLTVDDGHVTTGRPQARPQRIARPNRSPAGPVAWSLAGVTAGFGNQVVLEHVDAIGHQGEVVALCGPNGGGKTTLLRLISGAISPLAGKLERRPGRIAYLPHNPNALLHRPTLRSEVAFTLDRASESESADVILEALGLVGVAGRYPRDLSSGERQRAALAAVLPGRPGLVLLDEPTRGMDDIARDALVRLLSRLRDGGAAIVLATHDADLRAAVADRVLRVSGGQVTGATP
jgi:energy-coupling factor transporter ATP-binding protein EcfA2